jgi:hypothetical protein
VLRRAWHSDRLAAAENVDATHHVRVVLVAVTGNKEPSGDDGELGRSRYAASDDRHRPVPGCLRQRGSFGCRPSGG